MNITNANPNNLQFQGAFRLPKYKSKNLHASHYAMLLNQPREDIVELTKKGSKKKIEFFKKMSRKYNSLNPSYKKEIEDSHIVNQIYKLVKKPNDLHTAITSRFCGQLADLYQIFLKADNKDKLKFINKILYDITEPSDTYKYLYEELLESKYLDEYMKNYSSYRDYIKLNHTDENSIKNLDQMVSDGTYNSTKYTVLKRNRFFLNKNCFKNAKILNLDTFTENYTYPREVILKKILEYMSTNRTLTLSPESEEVIMDIIKSTTEDNYKLRKSIIKNYADYIDSNIENPDKVNIDYLKACKQLFETIDNDKYAKSFIKKIIKDNVTLQSIHQLNNIFATVPTAKLNIFSKNAIKIIRQTYETPDLCSILEKELENPFFETESHRKSRSFSEHYGMQKKQNTIFNKIKNIFIKLNNVINLLQYRYLTRAESKLTAQPIVDQISTNKPSTQAVLETKQILKEDNNTKPLTSVISQETKEIQPAPIVETPTIQPSVQSTIQPVVQDTIQKEIEHTPEANIIEDIVPPQTPLKKAYITPFINIKQDESKNQSILDIIESIAHHIENKANEAEKIKQQAKLNRMAKKEEIKKNIFEILGAKLSEKTFAKQKDEFSKNATKMRLSMLPEIFASIAETRKTDRAVGKKRINSSNKDVLELYLLINGTNKKYINYLLKKRNVDNTRMFEVKDIIEIIKKAEEKIQKDKKANPDYRANDARKYYNHLYESKIQQYGKVKNVRKVKASA